MSGGIPQDIASQNTHTSSLGGRTDLVRQAVDHPGSSRAGGFVSAAQHRRHICSFTLRSVCRRVVKALHCERSWLQNRIQLSQKGAPQNEKNHESVCEGTATGRSRTFTNPFKHNHNWMSLSIVVALVFFSLLSLLSRCGATPRHTAGARPGCQSNARRSTHGPNDEDSGPGPDSDRLIRRTP